VSNWQAVVCSRVLPLYPDVWLHPYMYLGMYLF
jgi:hypothetical protein